MEEIFLLEKRTCSRCKTEKYTFDFLYKSGSKVCKECHNLERREKRRKLGCQPQRPRKF